MANVWFKPLPDIDIPLLDGGAYSLHDDGAGKVVILDFWATWCAPCKDELPKMQALYMELRDEGLDALAVNAGEPIEVAKPYATELGLTMPTGSYSSEFNNAFSISKLPLVIIADRFDQMRARWDGYQPGYELKIAEYARGLIAEKEPPADKVADLLAGDRMLRILWSRELLGQVEGVTMVPGAGGGGRVLASVGRSLVLYRTDGQRDRKWETDAAPGLPRVSATADPEGYVAAVFRPGGERLLILRMPEGSLDQISAPEPVFDALPLGSSSLLLAAYEGLLEMSSDGEEVERLDGFGGASSVGLLGGAEKAMAVALEFDGRLTWLDRSMNSAARIPTSGDGWRLLVHENSPGEAGVVPMAVTAAVTGSFLEGRSAQAALATSDGRLLLIDLASGRRLLHAIWPGIGDLASGDMDGDGLDELVVASGSRLSVLTATAPPD